MKNFFPLFLALLWSLALPAQTIVPTQTDEIIIDNGAPGKADPGDRIRYKVTIQNTGAANGTGVQLNVVPDPRTTFVPGSFLSSPLAVNDVYTATGNVGIVVPAASGVKANDFDDALAGATVSVSIAPTHGTVSLATDGSFTYTPTAGYTGTDNFTYTLLDSDPVGGGVPTTDMATVTITISNVVWFVDNTGGGTGGTGTLTNPFKTPTDFNASAGPQAGHVVFLKNTGTNYTSGFVLKNNQLLYGSGHTGGSNLADILPFSLAPNSPALPAINGTRPIITNSSGIGIALASGNTVRGLDVGTTSGAKISGTNFGTLTIGNTTAPDVALSGGGQALNLSTGTFDATSKFVSITSTSSSAQGINLAGIAGTVAFGSTTISGSTTQGILIGTSTASIDLGNTSVTGGTDAVSLQNNSSGVRTFGTLTTSGNSGVGFLHAVGGGSTSVTGATSITTPGGNGIDIQASTTAVTFAGTTVNKSSGSGVGVNLGGNTGAVTFNTLAITNSVGGGLIGTNNVGQLTVTTGSGSISAAAGPAINISRASGGNSPVTLNFTNVGTSSSPANGVALTNVSGTLNATGGTISSATGTAFLVSGGTIVIVYGGSITGNSSLAVDIDNHDSGNITFQTGNITSTTQGIRVQNSNGGTIAFDNPSKNLNTATNTAVNLSSNSGAIITFSNGGLVLNTTTGAGFTATGGGTVNVTGSNNTINSVSNTALNVNATTIGASDLNFLSISAGNNTAAADPASGIILNTTGSSGGLTVTGTGTTTGSGGTIQSTNRGTEFTSAAMINLKNMNFTNANLVDGGTCGAADNSGCNAAVYLNTVAGVTLDNIRITGTTTQQGVNAKEVSDLQLLNSTITNAGNTQEEGGLYALNLSGTCAITNTSITFPGGRGVTIYNTSKTLAMTVTGSSFNDTQSSGFGADGFEMSAFGTSTTTMNISNCSFLRDATNGVQFIGSGNSVSTFNLTGSTLDYGTSVVGGGTLDLDADTNGSIMFNVSNNPVMKGAGTIVVNFYADGNASLEGRMNNNVVTLGNTAGTSGDGIRVLNQGTSKTIIEIKGNTVTGVAADNGIEVIARQGAYNAGTGRGRADAIIDGNTVNNVSGANTNIRVAAGASGDATTSKTCAWIKNNVVNLNGFSQLEGSARNNHELILQGGGTNIATNWDANANSPSSATAIITPTTSGTGVITVGGTCLAPTNPLP